MEGILPLVGCDNLESFSPRRQDYYKPNYRFLDLYFLCVLQPYRNPGLLFFSLRFFYRHLLGSKLIAHPLVSRVANNLIPIRMQEGIAAYPGYPLDPQLLDFVDEFNRSFRIDKCSFLVIGRGKTEITTSKTSVREL